MDIDNTNIIGTGLFVFTSLLGTYYLVLKIRDFHSEKPDPKLTYVTHTQMEKVRAEIMRNISESIQELRSLRAEIRDETKSLQKQYGRSLSETRDLIGKNAQSISALVAQSQIANQRIAELSLKTDRIVMKMKDEI